MYGLPKNTDLRFLHGKQLLQVCLGVNEVILRFHEELSITITARFSCVKADGEMTTYNDPRQAANGLMKLLDGTVVSAEGTEDGTLSLVFNTGEGLIIYDDSKQFESYVIVDRGDFKIIV